jgi:hypothetical protein
MVPVFDEIRLISHGYRGLNSLLTKSTTRDKIFSGKQPHQLGTEAKRFGDRQCLHHQGMMFHIIWHNINFYVLIIHLKITYLKMKKHFCKQLQLTLKQNLRTVNADYIKISLALFDRVESLSL